MTFHVHAQRAFVLLVALLLVVAAPAASAAERVYVSSNWAGYYADKGTYTGVSATWTVPKSSPTGDRVSADAVWIGIGGMQVKDLLQAGTQTIFVNGTAHYHAWYETLPDPQRQLPIEIRPGDKVWVSLQEVRTDVWQITFKNLSRKTTYTAEVAYRSGRTSAEWIVERPYGVTSAGSDYLPLNNFKRVAFSDVTATKDGKQLPLQKLRARRVVMSEDDGPILAAPATAKKDRFTASFFTQKQSDSFLRKFRPVPQKIETVQPLTIQAQTVRPIPGTWVIQIPH